MSNGAQEDNIAAIRQLLLAAFTPEELRRFCYDRPTFRPVVSRFGPGHGLDDMVDEVVEYRDDGLTLRLSDGSQRSVETVLVAVGRTANTVDIGLAELGIQTERGQIGLMKAFGYSRTEVGMHYAKFVVGIVFVGSIIGIAQNEVC